MKKMKSISDVIYIINMRKDHIRKSDMIRKLENIGWTNYEFIDAVCGDNLPGTKELVQKRILNKTFIDPNGKVNKNVIACALSHKKAYATFLNSEHETCLILEDDIGFSEEFYKMLLNNSLSDMFHKELYVNPRLRDSWECFFIGLSLETIPHYGSAFGCLHVMEYRSYTPDWAASAYVLNKKSAQRLIDNNSPVRYAADINIECGLKQIYCSNYSLLQQYAGKFTEVETSRIAEHINSYLRNTSYYSNTNMPHDQRINIAYWNRKEKNPVYESPVRHCLIHSNIDFKSIEFKNHTDYNGSICPKWAHINF
jgi:GR25 family glycosyltransferase involved in LPS biosynthesis